MSINDYGTRNYAFDSALADLRDALEQVIKERKQEEEAKASLPQTLDSCDCIEAASQEKASLGKVQEIINEARRAITNTEFKCGFDFNELAIKQQAHRYLDRIEAALAESNSTPHNSNLRNCDVYPTPIEAQKAYAQDPKWLANIRKQMEDWLYAPYNPPKITAKPIVLPKYSEVWIVARNGIRLEAYRYTVGREINPATNPEIILYDNHTAISPLRYSPVDVKPCAWFYTQNDAHDFIQRKIWPKR